MKYIKNDKAKDELDLEIEKILSND